VPWREEPGPTRSPGQVSGQIALLRGDDDDSRRLAL